MFNEADDDDADNMHVRSGCGGLLLELSAELGRNPFATPLESICRMSKERISNKILFLVVLSQLRLAYGQAVDSRWCVIGSPGSGVGKGRVS